MEESPKYEPVGVAEDTLPQPEPPMTKSKSWQRYSIALVMVIGYLAILFYAVIVHDAKTADIMLPSLPPMIVAVTAVWVHQAGNEQ